ncbi:hypothetical protein [Sphingobacterium sp.]|uniref:hypothetical protein n=1 Tax=Sphingobacterium sp. TaxID=341027 RepID=UPI002FD8D812
MKTWKIMLFFVSIMVIQTYAQEMTNIKGIRTFYWVKGLEKRKANEPIVIFESGIGMSGNNFLENMPIYCC